MSAAATAPSSPLLQEGTSYWEKLMDECKRQADRINSVVLQNGLSENHRVQWIAGSECLLRKSTYPNTAIKLRIGFYSWAPMISVSVTGDETQDLQFFAEEFEMPLAIDLDGSVVGIFEEGRSFSPTELATYLAQSLRRCFPGLCLH